MPSRVFWLAGVAAAGAILASCNRLSPSHSNAPLTSVQQVRELGPQAVHAPVCLRGSITYSDRSLQLLFLQDATGGVRVEGMPVDNGDLIPGRFIEVTGEVASGGSDPSIGHAHVKLLGGKTSRVDAIRATPRDSELSLSSVAKIADSRSAWLNNASWVAI